MLLGIPKATAGSVPTPSCRSPLIDKPWMNCSFMSFSAVQRLGKELLVQLLGLFVTCPGWKREAIVTDGGRAGG